MERFEYYVIFFRKHRARVEEQKIAADSPDYRYLLGAQASGVVLSQATGLMPASSADSYQPGRQGASGQATASYHRLPVYHLSQSTKCPRP